MSNESCRVAVGWRTFPITICAMLLFAPPATAADKPANLGQKIVAYCAEHKDQQVGDGECYALAAAALDAAGAQPQSGEDPSPEDYVWGKLVLVASAGPDGLQLDKGRLGDIRPGDILQFRDARIEHRTPVSYSFQVFPHHTAVVASVTPSEKALNIWEQNTQDQKIVTPARIQLDGLNQGRIRVYRPQPAESHR